MAFEGVLFVKWREGKWVCKFTQKLKKEGGGRLKEAQGGEELLEISDIRKLFDWEKTNFKSAK